MNFSPNRIRINYGSSEIELTDIKCPNKVDCQKLQLTFDINDDGVITPTIFALEDINPEWLNIEFDISEDALAKICIIITRLLRQTISHRFSSTPKSQRTI